MFSVGTVFMGRKAGRTRKTNAIILIVFIVALSVIGSLYTLTVYLPMYETERSHLLSLVTHADPQTLDPALAFDQSSYSIIVNIFDRLITNKRGTTDIFEPSLATSWETPDSTTYIFDLRTDIMFHDNTPFNAESVKYSFDRVKVLEGPSYFFESISTVEVLDTHKVKITLYQEFAPLLSIFAHPVASIVSPSAVEKPGTDFSENPVGTGPFKFDGWDLGRTLNLTANKAYFKGEPRLERIVFKSILEASARRTALEQGEIDLIFTAPPAVSSDDLTELEKNPDIQIFKGVSSSIEFLGFNLLKPPLNDSMVREAISYAIDYDAMISDSLGGRAERLAGAVPPGVFGHNPNLNLKQRDTAKARQLLTQAGYSNGFDITLTYNIENLERRKVAETIRNSLADVNINVRIKGLDWQSAIEEYLSMGHEMLLNGWTPDYFDADSYLTPQFHSVMGWANVFGLSNSSIDTLLDQGLSAAESSQRLNYYYKAQEMIVEQMPVIFLYIPSIYDCTRFNVENWVHSPFEVIDAYELYKT